MTMTWTQYWSDWFWKRAGGRSGYPADIAYAVMCALDVYVDEVANLTPASAAARIGRGGLWQSDGVYERGLRGCVIVGQAGAAILVEKSDDEAEKRFTIAHEVAHYILEVKRHHERASDRLGPEFADALYGLREATPTERIDAWLSNARSEAFAHFMDRAPGGGYGCSRTLEAECAADDLAVEILAPRSELAAAISSMGFSGSLKVARRIAERRYGLPEGIAERYAGRVVWQAKGGPSSAERWGFGV